MSLKTQRVSKFPFSKLDVDQRRGNFREVQLPYTAEEAMAQGREAAQRIHEYLMLVGTAHISLYDYYFTRRTTGRYYRKMMDGKEEALPPP
jgi:hypothetical protein